MHTPNLLVVMVDQMRLHAMSLWGTPGYELGVPADPVQTPNLDRFAQEGIAFSTSVSNAPVCSPFRGMFHSGLYPSRSRVTNNCHSQSAPFGCELPRHAVCWSDVLRRIGYTCGHIGKWHLDSPREPYIECENNDGPVKWNEWCPPDRRHGFDYWYSYGTFNLHLHPMYWTSTAHRHEHHRVDAWGPEHEVDKALDFLDRTRGPFALVVSMNPPHSPYDQVPAKYLERFKDVDTASLFTRESIDLTDGHEKTEQAKRSIRSYYAMVEGVDAEFGRLIEGLHARGLGDETIVLFVSDHGDSQGANHLPPKNHPLDEGLLVPTIFWSPSKLTPRHERSLLFSVPDFYPTLLGLMGLGHEVPAEVEGTDHSDYLISPSPEYPLPSSALYYKSSYDHTTDFPFGSWGERGVRTDCYTMAIRLAPDHPPLCYLWNLRDDRYQRVNVCSERVAVFDRLLAEELIPKLEKTADPWLENFSRFGHRISTEPYEVGSW